MQERQCKILPGIIQSVLKLLELCEGEGATKCSVIFFFCIFFFLPALEMRQSVIQGKESTRVSRCDREITPR